MKVAVAQTHAMSVNWCDPHVSLTECAIHALLIPAVFLDSLRLAA